MFITNYFQPRNPQQVATDENQRALSAGREAVELAAATGVAVSRKRKRSATFTYDDESKTKIGKHALLFGNKSAVQKFLKELGHSVPEATVRNFKRHLQMQLRQRKDVIPFCYRPTSRTWSRSSCVIFVVMLRL